MRIIFRQLDSIANKRGQSSGDAGGAADRVMNQLLRNGWYVIKKRRIYYWSN